MTRSVIVFLALTLTGSIAVAGVFTPTPFIPQEVVKPLIGKDQPMDGTADMDDPAKLAERIAENTKTAGDRLKDEDTSETTRQTQEQILKDIDKLLKQQGQQPPPPMGGGSPPPMGGGSPPPMGGGGKGGGQPPKGQGKSGGMPPMGGQQNQEPQRQTRREKREQEQGGTPQGKPMGMNPEPMPEAKKPMGMGEQPMPMNGDLKNPTGNGGTGGKTKPALPFEDAVTKQVWGHLPERLRQEMNQYYKEQFMPKYGEMLKQYYGSLAEREKAPKKP